MGHGLESGHTMRAGRFITFEGIEGCGKSTQAKGLAAMLSSRGLPVLSTREPGGTPVADALRAILLAPANRGLPGEAELLLLAAARAEHVRRKILPALEAGTHVICDRFSDSTRAYQGGGRGLPLDLIEGIDLVARGSLVPDVTILLDMPAEDGLARARARNEKSALPDAPDESRLDAEDLAFHRRVRSAFLRIAGDDPHRVWVVNAQGSVEDVAARVETVMRRVLPELLGGPLPRQAEP